MALDSLLMHHDIFKVLRDPDFSLLEETEAFTSQLNLFPSNPKDVAAVYLVENGEHELSPVSITVEDRWMEYRQTIAVYDHILHDIAAFNETIRNFINYALADLPSLKPQKYAESLYYFYNNPRAEKLIANL